MWKRISSSIRRHRKKLFIIGGVISGFVLLNHYLRRKYLEWEIKRRLEYFESMKRQSHFEGVLQNSDVAALTYAPKIRENVSSVLDVNPIVEALKSRNEADNKIKLWEELKVLIFTQAVGEMYIQSVLVVLLRVQFSILSGYMYEDCRKEVRSELRATDYHQTYLVAQISTFLDTGIKGLLKLVENSVRDVMRDVYLKDLLRLKDIAGILDKITLHLSKGKLEAIPSLSQYVILDSKNQEKGDSFLDRVTGEMKDILECADFHKILFRLIHQGYAILMDDFHEVFVHLSNNSKKHVEPHELAVPLARIIPRMHGVITQRKPDAQGSLIHVLIQEDILKCFAANIYESFSQYSEST